MVAVEARGVSFTYRQQAVLESVDLTARQGEVVSIIGANGAGKTTLLRCLTGLLQARTGTINIAGHDLAKTSREQLARLVAFVPQSSENRFPMSVFDAVLLGRRPYLGWYPKSTDLDLAAAAIERLGLDALALRNVNQLSGGERQKVALARAITQQAQVLLLDEPTTYLDLKHQLTVLGIVESLAADGVSVVMTMHDLNLALRAADRIVALCDGRILADEHPDQLTPEVINQVYEIECEITTAADQRIIIPTRTKS